MGWIVGASIPTFFGTLIATILWFFHAESFNVCQNVAVFVAVFLAFIAIMGATWAPWSMKHRDGWAEGIR